MIRKTTTVIAVNKKSKCVRTVIPNVMAELLQLSAGDKIIWEKLEKIQQNIYRVVTR